MKKSNKQRIEKLEKKYNQNTNDVETAKLLLQTCIKYEEFDKLLELYFRALNSAFSHWVEPIINQIIWTYEKIALKKIESIKVDDSVKNEKLYLETVIRNILGANLNELRTTYEKGNVIFTHYKKEKLPALKELLNLFIKQGVDLLSNYKTVESIDLEFKNIANFEECFVFLKTNNLSENLSTDYLLVQCQNNREINDDLSDSKSKIDKDKKRLKKEQIRLKEMKRNLNIYE